MLVVAGLLFMSFNQKQNEMNAGTGQETPELMADKPVASNIVEVAAGNEAFSTLVAAVKAADLVATLSSAGPFTVFAPTNDAFAKLPQGTVESLLKTENKEALTGILTYHVVAGKFEAAAVIEAINANDGKFTVATVQGGSIDLSLVDGNVILTDSKGGTATVVIADVAASNGVIHAIDAVVMPQ
tara:strand:+ start:4661 stop:5215 length:555 start_codon:yes stop_codon:yes gene_type:complete